MKISFLAAATVSAFVVANAHADVVFANDSPSGDHYTGGLLSNTQAIGSTGWYYSNVKSQGSAGIDTTYARSGDGSVRLQGTQNGSRADVSYFAGASQNNFGNIALNGKFTSSLGDFTDLSNFSYDWYRDSSVTGARTNLAPTFRIYLDRDGNLDTTSDRGELIFELVYTTSGAVATDTWITMSGDANTRLYNQGSFGISGFGNAKDLNGNGYGYDEILSSWQEDDRFENAAILGFGVSIGSGWGGAFKGATDNISWTIGGVKTITNFEVAPQQNNVPVPGSLMLLGAGLVFLVRTNRRAN